MLDIDSFYGDEFLEDHERDRLDEISLLLFEKEAEMVHRMKKQGFSLDQDIEDYEDSYYDELSYKEIKAALKAKLRLEMRNKTLSDAKLFKTNF